MHLGVLRMCLGSIVEARNHVVTSAGLTAREDNTEAERLVLVFDRSGAAFGLACGRAQHKGE